MANAHQEDRPIPGRGHVIHVGSYVFSLSMRKKDCHFQIREQIAPYLAVAFVIELFYKAFKKIIRLRM